VVKRTAYYAMTLLLLMLMVNGCSSTSTIPTTEPLVEALTISNGTDTIEPYLLFKCLSQYQDGSGDWIAADGEGNFQYNVADYEADFPSIKATDKMSINAPDQTKYSAVTLLNADFSEISYVTLSDITSLDAGTYYLKLEIEKIGRTIGDQTETTAYVGFVKIIVG
jgi:hypothetical protein